MRNDKQLPSLFAVLSALSSSDLQNLAAVLEDSAGRNTVATLISEILRWRHKQSAPSTSTPRERAPTTPDVKKGVPVKLTSRRPSRADVLTELLSDRRAFPSTLDVVKAVNAAFGFDIDYSKYKQLGRRDLVARCRKLLSQLPPPLRRQKLNAFFKRCGRAEVTEDQFSELFRVLASRA